MSQRVNFFLSFFFSTGSSCVREMPCSGNYHIHILNKLLLFCQKLVMQRFSWKWYSVKLCAQFTSKPASFQPTTWLKLDFDASIFLFPLNFAKFLKTPLNDSFCFVKIAFWLFYLNVFLSSASNISSFFMFVSIIFVSLDFV